MFFNQADREYLAELAKNNPERLMTKFDTRGARTGFDDDGNPVYDTKPDGKLDPEERMSLFDPRTGIKQMRADDEAIAKKNQTKKRQLKKVAEQNADSCVILMMRFLMISCVLRSREKTTRKLKEEQNVDSCATLMMKLSAI